MRNQTEEKKNIVVTFTNQTKKWTSFKPAKLLNSFFFVNDDLSAERQTIMFALRRAKKKCPGIVKGCSSNGSKNFTCT